MPRTPGTPNKPAPPPYDFTALKPVAVAAPRRAGGGIDPASNPAIAWLRESWAKQSPLNRDNQHPTFIGEGKQVTVPNVQVDRLKKLLNDAAAYLKVGVTIDTEQLKNGSTRVNFAAQTRRKYTPKPKAPNAPTTTT